MKTFCLMRTSLIRGTIADKVKEIYIRIDSPNGGWIRLRPDIRFLIWILGEFEMSWRIRMTFSSEYAARVATGTMVLHRVHARRFFEIVEA